MYNQASQLFTSPNSFDFAMPIMGFSALQIAEPKKKIFTENFFNANGINSDGDIGMFDLVWLNEEKLQCK